MFVTAGGGVVVVVERYRERQEGPAR